MSEVQEKKWEKVEDTDLAEMWNDKDAEFKPGDSIEGKLVEVKTGVGINKSNIYLIQPDGSEEQIGVWGSTVLDGKFAKIAIGSYVKVVYTGTAMSKARGKEYKTYEVYQATDL